MSRKEGFLSRKYSPFFKMLIQTLFLFVILTLPLSINITSTSPPYSINNEGPSGMTTFANLLTQNGFNVTRTILSTNPIKNLPESSILVIAGGEKKYRDAEKFVIDSFVVKGGTLILLASEGVAYDLAEYFGFYLTSSILLDTAVSNSTPSPEILLIESPFNSSETLCFFRAKHIITVTVSPYQSELISIRTPNTTFLDENNDYKWNMVHEPLRQYRVASLINRGLGKIMVITSPSFLTNDLSYIGFNNINTTIQILGNITATGQKLVCFEESHKRWPFTSTDGIINQTYGTIILLSKTKLFIFLIIIILLLFYYLTPRFRETYQMRDSYKKFISQRIWSRSRELFDTFGTPIKPTVEEKYLSYLYFQHELYPDKAYNYFLAEKLKFVPTQLINEEERKLFELALTRKLDHQTFLFLFKKLEEIQKRGRFV